MSDELIKKNALISTLKNWLSEDMPAHSTMYGNGYDDAVKDIIKLIETEMPVNAVELPCVELPCKVGEAVYYIRDRDEDPYIAERIFDPITIVFPGNGDLFYSMGNFGFQKSEVGVEVFLTREEAERALEDLKNG